jgi:hypothetical protein
MAEEKTESPKPALSAERKEQIKSQLQIAGLFLLLLLLMSTAAVTAFMALGIIDIAPTTEGPANSMTDAQLICDKTLQEQHGDKLQIFTLDDLSSHADDETGGYKLYYELNMFRDPGRMSGVNKFYVNCFVSANGQIRRMDLYEEKDYVPRPSRKTKGNDIGL